MGCGADNGADNCGWHGAGGDAVFLAPGLYSGHVDREFGPDYACFYVNANCTALMASPKCNVGAPAPRAHLAAVSWSCSESCYTGGNEVDEQCSSATVRVTPDLLDHVPVPIRGASFTIEFADAEGSDWWIHGYFTSSWWAEVEGRRTTDTGHCEYPVVTVVNFEVPSRMATHALTDHEVRR